MNATELEVSAGGHHRSLLEPVLKTVDEQTAQSLSSAYSGFFARLRPLLDQAVSLPKITNPEQVAEMKVARQLRLALREIRIEADKTRKSLKENALRYGKAVDGIYNVIAFSTEPIEKRLQQEEDFIENVEKERKAKLRAAREAELLPLGVDTKFYNLEEMPEEVFVQLVSTHREAKRLAEENARIAAEKAREDARIAAEKKAKEDEERKKLQEEQRKLQAEKDRMAEFELQQKIERDRLEAQRHALQIESDRLRVMQEAASKNGTIPNTTPATPLFPAAQNTLPDDKQKLLTIAEMIRRLKLQFPSELSTASGRIVLANAKAGLDQLVEYVVEEASKISPPKAG